jgi:hypothetical protein
MLNKICTMTAKSTPWWLVRRDNLLAKVPGQVTADGATNVYSLNRRAVMCQAKVALLQLNIFDKL